MCAVFSILPETHFWMQREEPKQKEHEWDTCSSECYFCCSDKALRLKRVSGTAHFEVQVHPRRTPRTSHTTNYLSSTNVGTHSN